MRTLDILFYYYNSDKLLIPTTYDEFKFKYAVTEFVKQLETSTREWLALAENENETLSIGGSLSNRGKKKYKSA